MRDDARDAQPNERALHDVVFVRRRPAAAVPDVTGDTGDVVGQGSKAAEARLVFGAARPKGRAEDGAADEESLQRVSGDEGEGLRESAASGIGNGEIVAERRAGHAGRGEENQTKQDGLPAHGVY